jgi:hypothetical protein
MRIERGTGEEADERNDTRGTPHAEPRLQRSRRRCFIADALITGAPRGAHDGRAAHALAKCIRLLENL